MTPTYHDLMRPTHDSRKARRARRRGRGFSWCGRCGMPWSKVHGHSTDYREGSGMFPLCEACWAFLTAEERLPYYLQLIELWRVQNPEGDYGDDFVHAVTEAVMKEPAKWVTL